MELLVMVVLMVITGAALALFVRQQSKGSRF